MKKPKTLPQLRKQLTLEFNKFIRQRDKNFSCISCRTRPVQQAGHYWSTSQCPQPSMRFNEKNVNGQCIYCNTFLEGNRQGYQSGLLEKYGAKILEELDICRSSRSNPWTRWEYEQMIKLYQKKQC